MGLETGTYISDLVSTNPVGGDPKSQGDDHIRLLKSAIKTTFPNVSGEVTPTHTELNTVTSRSLRDGDTYTGTHDFTGATATVATQTATDNTTKAASTAFVNQVAFNTALPAQPGGSDEYAMTSTGGVAAWSRRIFNAPTIVSGTSQTATAWNHYVLTNASTTTVTLPSSATAGDEIMVTNSTTTLTHVIAANGLKIMSSTSDRTFDYAYLTLHFRYADATRGWIIL